MKIIETDRLILRTWKNEDADQYYRINQDPKVIEFLRGPLTLEEVNQFMAVANQRQENWGFTLWAAELKKTQELIGFIGLNYADWGARSSATIRPLCPARARRTASRPGKLGRRD